MPTPREVWAAGDWPSLSKLVVIPGEATAAAANVGPGDKALDVGAGCVGLQQRVIDHPGDSGGNTTGRVHAETGGARVDHDPQPVGAAIAAHGVAAASARGRPCLLRRDHLLGDELDEPLEILRVQHTVVIRARPGLPGP